MTQVSFWGELSLNT